MKIEWKRICIEKCDRCEKDSTHIFKKRSFLKKQIKNYCDEHILERLKDEGVE